MKPLKCEFVIEATSKGHSGDTPEAVFNTFADCFFDCKGKGEWTPEEKAARCFKRYKIEEAPPDFSNGERAFYDAFFGILQKHLVGTWRWYNSLVGPCWRPVATGNTTLVRRKQHGMGKIKRSKEEIERCIKNITNPMTKAKAKAGIKAYWANLSPEERERKSQEASERAKRMHVKRRLEEQSNAQRKK